MNNEHHVYAKHIEKKNLNGYVVNNSVPFLKLFDAEKFCMLEGVQPDKDHLTYDPKNARILAIMLLPEMRRLLNMMNVEWSKANEKFHADAEMIRRMENGKRDILVDVEINCHRDRLTESLGALNRINAHSAFMRKRIYELEVLSRLIVRGDS